MKKILTIIVCILLIVGAVALSRCDNNDMTAALIFALLSIAIIFDKEEKRNAKE